MSNHPPISDPVACQVLSKLGEEGLVSIGSLLQIWEGKRVELGDKKYPVPPEPSAQSAPPECLLDREFVDSTRLELALASDEIKDMGEEIKALKKDLESSRKESLGLRGDSDKTRRSLEESLDMMTTMKEEMTTMKEEMKTMKEDMEDTKEDMDSLLKVNKDIYEKLESVEAEIENSLLGKRSICPDPDWFSKKIKVSEEVDSADFDAVANMLE